MKQKKITLMFTFVWLVGSFVFSLFGGGDGVSPQDLQDGIQVSAESMGKGKGGDGTGPRK